LASFYTFLEKLAMLKGLNFKELPDIDDKYTADERARFDSLIVENKTSSLKRFKDYQADLRTLNEYGQYLEEAALERSAVQPAATGYVQSTLSWAGNKWRAYQSGRTPLAQAIFEHNTALAVSLIEKGDFDESIKFNLELEKKLIDRPHFLPLGYPGFDPNDPLDLFSEEMSVLHYAIFHKEIDIVRALIRKNPELMNAEFKKMNPLNYAILLSYHYGYDRQAIALALIESGSDLESEVDGLTSIQLAKGLRRIALALYRKGVVMHVPHPDLKVVNVVKDLLNNGYESTAIALINAGADIHFTMKGDWHFSTKTIVPLLDYAIGHSHWGLALALVKRGVDLNQAHDWDERPLAKALFNDQAEVALAMIARSESFDNGYGQYLLYTAISRGLKSVAQALYAKVDINGAYQARHTQHRHLDTAINSNQPEIALDLINAGINMPEGMTHYLHRAIIRGLKDVVLLLLEKGADTQETTQSAYFKTEAINAFECVLSFYDDAADYIERNQNNVDGLIMDIVAEHRTRFPVYAEIAAIICKHQRTKQIEPMYNHKPVLHHFIFEGSHRDIAVALVTHNAVDIEGIYDEMTPMHHAIRRNRPDIALALINKGAKLDVLFKEMTPLHHAIRENNTAVALALIAKDPDLNSHAKYRGKTVLEHALAVQEEAYQYQLKNDNTAVRHDNPIVAELKNRVVSTNTMVVDATSPSEPEQDRRKRRKI